MVEKIRTLWLSLVKFPLYIICSILIVSLVVFGSNIIDGFTWHQFI